MATSLCVAECKKGNMFAMLWKRFLKTLNGSSGSIAKVEALMLLINISDFTFIAALVTWHNILFQVKITSKILQEKDLSLQGAVSNLKKKRGVFGYS